MAETVGETLWDVLAAHRANRADATAIVFEGARTDYATLYDRARSAARALAASGIGTGDRFIYLGKNSDTYFELLFAAAMAGAVLTPVGWRLAAAEAAFIIDDAEARLVVVGPEGNVQAAAVRALLGGDPLFLGVEDGSYAAWRDQAGDVAPPAVSPDNVVLQLYTSGTTGHPKGVTLTHRNLLAGKYLPPLASLTWNHWHPDDVALNAMPVAHVGGSNWGLSALVGGATVVILREFDPAAMVRAITAETVTKMFLVPAALRLLLAHPAARTVDYSRLRYVLYGASPIPLDLLRDCVETFGCGMVQQYGMTETTGTVVYLPPDDHAAEGNVRMRSAGLPLPGVEVRIVDAQGVDADPGGTGEILVRSALTTPGYWKRDADTRAAIDADGWLRTGDAGYVDADGYLFIHDRVKDMIITGGENVYPAEVESAIYGHPAVADVAVIGVPDERWGEAVKAIVVARPGHDVSPDLVMAHARARIAAFKCPKSVDFVEQLPRNAAGKILRRELREPYWRSAERRVS